LLLALCFCSSVCLSVSVFTRLLKNGRTDFGEFCVGLRHLPKAVSQDCEKVINNFNLSVNQIYLELSCITVELHSLVVGICLPVQFFWFFSVCVRRTVDIIRH